MPPPPATSNIVKEPCSGDRALGQATVKYTHEKKRKDGKLKDEGEGKRAHGSHESMVTQSIRRRAAAQCVCAGPLTFR